ESFVTPTRNLKAGAWAVLLSVAGVFALVPNLKGLWRIDTWLTWRDDYLTLFNKAPIGDVAPDMWVTATLSGMGVRLLLLGVGFALCWAWLTVLPRSSSAITVWGTRTLAVYLLHGPIIYALRQSALVNTIGGWSLLLVICIGVGIAVLLSLEPFTRFTRPLIQPRNQWLWGTDPQRATT